MIPLRDDQPRFSTPYVTYFLIGLNLVIFLFEATLTPQSFKGLLYPVRTWFPPTSPDFWPAVWPVGLHSGISSHPHFHVPAWLMDACDRQYVVLWIFGDNVEDHLGHFKYLLFYLLTGLGAALAQVVLNPHSRVPTVGASGAIAGVLGAYFLLYPSAKVLIWFPIFFLFYLPAWVTLGLLVCHAIRERGGNLTCQLQRHRGGVAFWAHVGGFVAGIVLIKLIPERPRRYRYGTW